MKSAKHSGRYLTTGSTSYRSNCASRERRSKPHSTLSNLGREQLGGDCSNRSSFRLDPCRSNAAIQLKPRHFGASTKCRRPRYRRTRSAMPPNRAISTPCHVSVPVFFVGTVLECQSVRGWRFNTGATYVALQHFMRRHYGVRSRIYGAPNLTD